MTSMICSSSDLSQFPFSDILYNFIEFLKNMVVSDRSDFLYISMFPENMIPLDSHFTYWDVCHSARREKLGSWPNSITTRTPQMGVDQI